MSKKVKKNVEQSELLTDTDLTILRNLPSYKYYADLLYSMADIHNMLDKANLNYEQKVLSKAEQDKEILLMECLTERFKNLLT